MSRRPRADAAHNAEVIREAARELFAREGIRVPLDQVARAAGLSIGTLYNHFSRREDLLAATLPDVARDQERRIREASLAAGEPAERCRAYLREVFAVQATDRLLADALASPEMLPREAIDACAEVVDLGVRLLSEAHAAGVDIRLTSTTLRALLLGNAAVHRAGSPEGWDAVLDELVTGLTGEG